MKNAELDHAIALRSEGNLEASKALLLELVALCPRDATVNYQCAWTHDAMGLEHGAAPFYEQAICCGLAGEELEGALLGLGSTYRCIGEYEKAEATLHRGMMEFPANYAMRVFLAMALHNLGKHDEAMEYLLNCIADTSLSPHVTRFRRAIRFYSDKLGFISGT